MYVHVHTTYIKRMYMYIQQILHVCTCTYDIYYMYVHVHTADITCMYMYIQHILHVCTCTYDIYCMYEHVHTTYIACMYMYRKHAAGLVPPKSYFYQKIRYWLSFAGVRFHTVQIKKYAAVFQQRGRLISTYYAAESLLHTPTRRR